MNSEVLKINAAQVNPTSAIQFFVCIMLLVLFFLLQNYTFYQILIKE